MKALITRLWRRFKDLVFPPLHPGPDQDLDEYEAGN